MVGRNLGGLPSLPVIYCSFNKIQCCTMDVELLKALDQGQGLALALLQVLLQHVKVPTGGSNELCLVYKSNQFLIIFKIYW